MRLSGLLISTKLTFVSKHHERDERDDITTFRFHPEHPVTYLAGQHAIFALPKGLMRWHIFSLASTPTEEDILIGTHVRPGSAYKRQLDQLQPGDTVTMRGPYLDFVLEPGTTDTIYLAQGIGITPFRSLILHHAKDPGLTTTLIHVDDTPHTYRTETEPNVTTAHYPTTREDFTTLVTSVVAQHPNAIYYASGSPKFVKATTKTLQDLGIKNSAIKKDSYLGY